MNTPKVVSFDDAGRMYGKSKKRLQNMVSSYIKKNRGSLPPWVVNTSDTIHRMIDLEEFERSLRQPPKSVGRPRKGFYI